MLRAHSRRSALGGAAIIVAIIALGISIVFVIDVAMAAIHFRMDFIEQQAGHRVLEVLLIPTGMTCDAHRT